MGLINFVWKGRHDRVGFELYRSAVMAARSRHLYTHIGVPDTLDGRFEMVSLYAFLLVHRLQQEPAPGPAVAQAVFDAMFSDMDFNLREMGVGDLSVGRKVKVMWEAFHGRSAAYATALEADNILAFDASLARNVWRGAPPSADASRLLRRAALQGKDYLTKRNLSELMRGRIKFPPVENEFAAT